MFSYRGYICYETDDEYDECNYDEYFTSFEGDFDGQGYMINGLRMKSSLYYVGIFGYSSGMSAKNVVIGPSCSFVGTTHYNFSAVGSLIGVSDGSSYIEGVVNMAHVSFDGDVSVESEVGGIAGYVDGKFKNCINFGSVSNSGRAKLRSYTGGIVGDGASAYNCINYGTVSVGFKSDSLYAGGITGDSSRSAKNCVSAGKIKLSKSAKNANNYYVGAITPGGSGNSANCHCASNVGYTSGCSVVGLDSTTVSELNSYAEDKGYDSWYTFHLKGGRIGNKKDEVLCMIPDYPLRPAKSYNTFSYWCLSEKCSLESIIDGSGMGSSLDFYAKWKVDAGLVIGTVIAIVACPAAIFLVVGAFLYVGIVENKMKVNRESIDIALSWLKKLRSSSKGVAVTLQQMETLKIVDECIDKKFSQNSTKSADTNKSVCEILEEINVNCKDSDIGSFKTKGVAQAIADSAQNDTNVSTITEYLHSLYTEARRAEYQEYEKLYFGMKDRENFFSKKDKQETFFGCIVSAFTNKRKVIRLLSVNEDRDLPRGVLFEVTNGKGYKMDSAGSKTDEVLFEINSRFKIGEIKEVIPERYTVVKLSFEFPKTDDELVML